MPGSPHRVLVVEDAEEVRELLVLLLEGDGFTVTACEDDVQALASLARERPDVILTDLMLGAASGLDLITRIRGDLAPPVPPIVACSGFGDFEAEALRRGAVAFIPKPFTEDTILKTLRTLLASRQVADSERDEAQARSRSLRARAVAAAEVAMARLVPVAEDMRRRGQLSTAFLPRYLGFGQAFVAYFQGEELRLGASSLPSTWQRGAPLEEPIYRDILESRSALVIPDLGSVGASVRGPTGQPLRFFAGVPIVADTVAVGALCLVDAECQSLGSDGFALLEAIARRATAVLSAKGSRLAPLWSPSGLFTREALGLLLGVELNRMQQSDGSLSLFLFAGSAAAMPQGPRSASAELGAGRFGAMFACEGGAESGRADLRFITEVAGRDDFRGGALVTLSAGAEIAVDAGSLLRTAEHLLENVLGLAPGTLQQIVVRHEPLVLAGAQAI